MSKVALFPASGELGTSVYTHLLKHVHPSNLILMSRDPSQIPAEYVQAGVTTRQADYDSLETLAHAFDDVSHLVLVSYPGIEDEHRFKVSSQPCRLSRIFDRLSRLS